MTCSIPDCENLAERSGKCATHARLERRALTNASKPKPAPKRIAKVGTKNLFECSYGEKVTDSQVRQRLGEVYHKLDKGQINVRCEGCEIEPATCHAHIIAKARCKQIHKAELIWDVKNFFNSCWTCNTRAENISSPDILTLKNYPRIKAFMIEHDYERATKLPDFSIANEKHKI